MHVSIKKAEKVAKLERRKPCRPIIFISETKTYHTNISLYIVGLGYPAAPHGSLCAAAE
jgi:hypothetical protein